MIVLNRLFTPIPIIKDEVQISLDNKETWLDFEFSPLYDANDYDRPPGYHITLNGELISDGTCWIRMNNGKKLSSIEQFDTIGVQGIHWLPQFADTWVANETIDGLYTYYQLYYDIYNDPTDPGFMSWSNAKLHLTLQ